MIRSRFLSSLAFVVARGGERDRLREASVLVALSLLDNAGERRLSVLDTDLLRYDGAGEREWFDGRGALVLFSLSRFESDSAKSLSLSLSRCDLDLSSARGVCRRMDGLCDEV